MAHLFYYSRFFGHKWGVIEGDTGDAYLVRVNDTTNLVRKSEMGKDEYGSWWESAEAWADSVVARDERWVASKQSDVDEIETEIAALRAERAKNLAEAAAELARARQWRAAFKLEPPQ